MSLVSLINQQVDDAEAITRLRDTCCEWTVSSRGGKMIVNVITDTGEQTAINEDLWDAVDAVLGDEFGRPKHRASQLPMSALTVSAALNTD